MTQPFTAAVVQEIVQKWAVAVSLYSQYAFLKKDSEDHDPKLIDIVVTVLI